MKIGRTTYHCQKQLTKLIPTVTLNYYNIVVSTLNTGVRTIQIPTFISFVPTSVFISTYLTTNNNICVCLCECECYHKSDLTVLKIQSGL